MIEIKLEIINYLESRKSPDIRKLSNINNPYIKKSTEKFKKSYMATEQKLTYIESKF